MRKRNGKRIKKAKKKERNEDKKCNKEKEGKMKDGKRRRKE